MSYVSSHPKGTEQDQLRSPFVPYVRNIAERSIHNFDSQSSQDSDSKAWKDSFSHDDYFGPFVFWLTNTVWYDGVIQHDVLIVMWPD